tara:strand:- start:1492 stop:1713 length:222 start_codon:yes stop_codon:yes gene_type:complete
MNNSDVVKFNRVPGPNTPGAPTAPYDLYSGVVVKETIDVPSNGLVDSNKWCEVLWSNNQITRCYKEDLKVVSY